MIYDEKTGLPCNGEARYLIREKEKHLLSRLVVELHASPSKSKSGGFS